MVERGGGAKPDESRQMGILYGHDDFSDRREHACSLHGWGVLARFGCYAAVGATLGLIQEISYQQPHAREWLRLHIHDEKFD
jgi:hypothetical protein